MKAILRIIFIPIFYFIFWPFIFFKKYGEKDVDFLDNSLVIANHYSNLDPFLLYLLIKKKKRIYFVTNADVKKHFFTRFFCYFFNCLYVEMDNPIKNIPTIKKSINVLKNGGVIVIFPEGVIRPSRNGFFEFNSGFIYLARKANSKIYPLFIYPEVSIFKRSKIYINNYVDINDLKDKDDIEAAMFLQSIVMDSSFKLEKEIESK